MDQKVTTVERKQVTSNEGRDERGRFIPGYSGNLTPKPRRAFRDKILAAAPQILDNSIQQAINGDKKMAMFLLSRTLPEKSVLETNGGPIELTESAIENLKNIWESYKQDDISSGEMNVLLSAVQKQMEIQQGDISKLIATVGELTKKIESHD